MCSQKKKKKTFICNILYTEGLNILDGKSFLKIFENIFQQNSIGEHIVFPMGI